MNTCKRSAVMVWLRLWYSIQVSVHLRQWADGKKCKPKKLRIPGYMRRLQEKTRAIEKSRKAPLKISTKILLKTSPLSPDTNPKPPPTLDDLFPDKTPRIRNMLPTTRKIGFKFAGCCPVPAKPRKNLSIVKQFEQSAESLATFNSKFVIGRRKLLKSIFVNDRPPIEYFMDYRWLNL